MRNDRRRTKRPALRLPLIALLFAAAAGCSSGVDVTPRSVDKARAQWRKANVRDYDLEWMSGGPQGGQRFRVVVRGGKVQSVSFLRPDGAATEAKPAKPEFYGVEGLFQVLDDDLAQLKSPTPFGRPKGTRVVLRFTPDPDLGYPKSYRRDVIGQPRGVAFDVVRLDRK